MVNPTKIVAIGCEYPHRAILLLHAANREGPAHVSFLRPVLSVTLHGSVSAVFGIKLQIPSIQVSEQGQLSNARQGFW